MRAVLVDDHPVFRIGMAALLDSLGGVRVVGQAASAREAGGLLLGPDPVETDVVVMDLDLGDGSGIEITRGLQRARPDVAVLVMTMHEEDDTVVAAVRAGRAGTW